MKKLFSLFICSLFLFSCKQEYKKVDLLTNNSKEIFFELGLEDVVNIYTEIDVEYKEKPSFVYHCEFRKGRELLFEGGTDPLVTTENMNESLVVKSGITHWKFYGKLDGNLTARADGKYSIKTTFLKKNNPDLKINKAEIVFIKQ